jgi:AcrR family transcriptional regulator
MARARTDRSAGPSTKDAIVLTAERLFAVHGLDGVSLRRIGTEAGCAMNTAVQYHFGTKELLVEAIVANRAHELADRRERLERDAGDDLRSVVEAHLLPIVELGEDVECYYPMFLEQLQRYGLGDHPAYSLPEVLRGQREYLARVSRLLTGVPVALREGRINRTSALCLHVCADRQRARSFGAPVEPYELYVSQLFDGLVAFLSAVPSDATRRALRASQSSASQPSARRSTLHAVD